MKILVTGANGQLGNCLRKQSAGRPHDRFIFTDVPEADITDRECMDRLIRTCGAEAVVNCAAYTAVDKAESEPESCARINETGPAVLGELAGAYDIPLIHISTDYVFDGKTCRPMHEDHPTCPTGVYGRTKLAGELAVKNSGCRGAVIRTAWLYSEFGNNFVKTMIRLGRERGALNVVYDQVGTPTYAGDLAAAILALLDGGIVGCETYHYSNEGVASWYDFARKIFQLEGIRVDLGAIESTQYPTPAERPAYSVLSKDKIKSKGIPVPYWEDSLKVCLEELKKISKTE